MYAESAPKIEGEENPRTKHAVSEKSRVPGSNPISILIDFLGFKL